MKIALYQGKSWISKAICWQTRGSYSHAAIMLPTGIIEAWHNPGKVRLQHSLSDNHTPGTLVDVFEVATNHNENTLIECFLRKQIGKKYDFRAIARFISRRDSDNAERWFCSELVFAAFKAAGIDLLARTDPFEVSPVMLSRSPLLTLDHSTITY